MAGAAQSRSGHAIAYKTTQPRHKGVLARRTRFLRRAVWSRVQDLCHLWQ